MNINNSNTNSINNINNINSINSNTLNSYKNELNISNYIRTKRMKRIKRKFKEINKENILDNLLNTPIPKRISKIKITPDNFVIPEYKNYNWLLIYDYNITNLKEILKKYNRKLSGNKNELVIRIYNYLKINYNSILIQKIFRSHIVKQYINLHGPAFKNKNLCVNNEDFCTRQKISEIPYEQFFSFKNNKNYIYGFDILSIYNLYLQNNKLENPFTKEPLESNILSNILLFIQYSKLLNINININFSTLFLNDNNNLNLRIISIFHEINLLGNYSNSLWFNNLSKHLLIQFLNELIDIWNYRANLLSNVKCEICPPNGNPFRNYISMNMHILNYYTLKKICVNIIDALVNSGINNQSRGLGAYYVLACLTLVNTDAAEAMPWLYQSVIHD